MSWTEREAKRQSSIKVKEEENDFPIAKPNFMRIGAAHAVEHKNDRELLVRLLGKFVQDINGSFDPTATNNEIKIEEK